MPTPTAPFVAAVEGVDPRERALAQRLAYGTIQRVRTLDHGIEQLGGRPVDRLDHPVQAALRLGAYQLAYSEVAVHAAVNETVELVRTAGLERAVKFANAVMRRLALGLRELVDGSAGGDARAGGACATRIRTGSRTSGGAISAPTRLVS